MSNDKVVSLSARRKAEDEKRIEAARLRCGDGCRGCAWCMRNSDAPPERVGEKAPT